MKTVVKWTLNALAITGAVAIYREYKLQKTVNTGIEDIEKSANAKS